MVHQPRRTATRLAGLLLGGVIAVGLLLGMTGPLTGAGARSASAAEDTVAAGADLDADTRPLYQALSRLRSRADLPALSLDEDLTESAERDACAIARGELQLSGNEERLAESGAQRENVGLVVDDDPVSGAAAMHDWWTQTPAHRADRLDPDMRRYGIGACTAQERTYYVERLAS
jgi:uncharacterized protein YkwD